MVTRLTLLIAAVIAVAFAILVLIAHELRTPLTNIKGQLEAAKSGLVATDQELLETLGSETRLLDRLVEDFHQLAISDAGQLRISSQSIPLAEFLRNVLTPIAVQESVLLEIDVPANISIYADEDRMKQVLGNLMENAIRHKPGQLRIRIDARNDNGITIFTFADNGNGIDIEHLPIVFDRFYRAEKSRNRETGGSGLGLSIVKAIIEAMDGSIRYVDDADSGAKFEIRLSVG